MNQSLQYFLYLCQIKNDLNRKRRRFHSIVHRRHGLKDATHISKADAMVGYYKAQSAMKAMTSEMRMIRVNGNFETKWDSCGNIEWVRASGVIIKQRDFKSYYEAERFEQIVFSNK